MGIFKNLLKKEEKSKEKEYFDVSDLLEQVRVSEDWVCATFKEPQEDIDDELIYYNDKLNLAFKFIIDEQTNTVGMKKVEPNKLNIDNIEKSCHLK